MAGSVNAPSLLAIGDLASTTLITLGRGAALAVDNSTPTGSIAASAIAASRPLNLGSNSLTCGTVSCGAIAASGTLVCGALTSAGTLGCGALIAGAASCGEADFGTNPLTCGSLTCSSVVCSGLEVSKRWWARAALTSDQLASNATQTNIAFQALETSGGASANFPVTFPVTTFLLPQAGMYLITYNLTLAPGSGNYQVWVTFPLDTSARFAYRSSMLVGSGLTSSCGGSATFSGAANRQVVVRVIQNTGSSLAILGTGNTPSSIQIFRLSE